MREILSHTERSRTKHALASSEISRVTTETTIGSWAGENSKQNFAQWWSSIHTISTPASYWDWKSTVTRALSWKSPSGGVPTRVAPLSIDSASVESSPAGLTYRSV